MSCSGSHWDCSLLPLLHLTLDYKSHVRKLMLYDTHLSLRFYKGLLSSRSQEDPGLAPVTR